MSISLIKKTDKYIGTPVSLGLGALSKLGPEKEAEDFEDILVIQLWGVGETVLTLPALNALRQRFPKSKIDILATARNKEVYEAYGKDFNHIITLDMSPASVLNFMLKNRRKYSLVVDMEEYLNISSNIAFFVGDFRIGFGHGARAMLYDKKADYNDQQHTVLAFLDLVKLVGADAKYEKLLPLDDIPEACSKNVDEFIKDNKLSGFVVGLVPGAAESSKSRMWPREKFAKLADALIEKYRAKVVFIGSNQEFELTHSVMELMKHRKEALSIAGSFNLKETIYFISKLKFLISNDTGPMHIGAAQGVPTIGLFGPNIPIRWMPYGQQDSFVYKGDVCKYSPCINTHKGEVPECLWGKNNKDYMICMKIISVDDVLDVVGKRVKIRSTGKVQGS